MKLSLHFVSMTLQGQFTIISIEQDNYTYLQVFSVVLSYCVRMYLDP